MRKLLPLVAGLFPAGFPAARAQNLGVKGGLSYGNVSHSGLLPGNLGGRTGFAIAPGARLPGVAARFRR